MNVFSITVPTSTTPRIVTYNVRILGYNSSWTTVFTGKVYIMPGQNNVKIDLGDILWNYKLNGDNYFAPTLNLAGDNYILCNPTTSLSNYWYNDVKVEFPTLSGVPSVTKKVMFFNYNMFSSFSDAVANNTVAIKMNYQPICHIPDNAPDGFMFRQLVWNGSFTVEVDENSTTYQVSNLGCIPLNGAQHKYSINGETIAVIDSCPKPYYLVWMTNTGGLQCQPFLKGSQASVKYSNNQRVDMSNFRWNYNKTVTGCWNLKSENLVDRDYKAMGEMFNSPYLLLLDMENNRQHFVNITDTTYKQKKNAVGSKKIYFEINVESAEIKTI